MRWKSTVFLLFANILWLCMYYVYTQNKNSDSAAYIFPIKFCAGDISALDISFGESNAKYSFKRDKNEWFIQKPFLWPANGFSIENLLHQLSNIESGTMFSTKLIKESGQSLDSYGLKNPSVELTLYCGDKKFSFAVGAKVHLSKNMYILDKNTNDVIVVAQDNLKQLFCNNSNWYNTYIFYSGLKNVSNINFRHKQQNVFIRKDGNQWFIRNPINAKANNERTDLIIGQIQSLELLRFLTEDEIKTFLPALNDEQSVYTIILADDNSSKTLKLANYNADEQIYLAQLESYAMPFLLRTNVIDRLANTQETLRERKIFSIDLQKVQKIEFGSKSQKTILQKIQDSNWEINSYENTKVINTAKTDFQKIENLINNLNALTVEEFLENSSIADLDNKNFEFNAKFEIQTNNELFEFNIAESDNKLFLKFKDESTLLKIALANKELIFVKFDNFVDKTIWRINENEKIVKLDFINIYNLMHITYDVQEVGNKNSSFNIILAKNKQKDAINWIANSIRALRAKKFASLTFQEESNVFNSLINLSWPYQLKISTIDKNKITREYLLNISERISASFQLANANGKTFWLKQDWINALFFITDWPNWKSMADIYNK